MCAPFYPSRVTGNRIQDHASTRQDSPPVSTNHKEGSESGGWLKTPHDSWPVNKGCACFCVQIVNEIELSVEKPTTYEEAMKQLESANLRIAQLSAVSWCSAFYHDEIMGFD